MKILLPEELQKVDSGLRKIGMGNLADEGLKLMNRAAEDAVKKATPIFINTIKDMDITDAKQILLGHDQSATDFLESKTSGELYTEFFPVVNQSLRGVGADQLFTKAVNAFNRIPFRRNVDPDLSKYMTNQALDGVFTMIAIEGDKKRFFFRLY